MALESYSSDDCSCNCGSDSGGGSERGIGCDCACGIDSVRHVYVDAQANEATAIAVVVDARINQKSGNIIALLLHWYYCALFYSTLNYPSLRIIDFQRCKELFCCIKFYCIYLQ